MYIYSYIGSYVQMCALADFCMTDRNQLNIYVYEYVFMYCLFYVCGNTFFACQ